MARRWLQRTGVGLALASGTAPIGAVGSDCFADGVVVHSVADDFSIASNPDGPWSYGYTDGLGSALILFVESYSAGGAEGWLKNISLGAPAVVHNTTSRTIVFGTPVLGPGQAAFHPGPSGQFCVYRFTAPQAGEYAIDASFVGADTWGTVTSVHILHNDTQVFGGSVSGYGPGSGPTFAQTIALAEGDRIDFAVGAEGSFFNDTTGIAATLTLGVAACPADLNGDAIVDAADLAILLGAWGGRGAADLDENDTVDAADLAILLGAWGDC